MAKFQVLASQAGTDKNYIAAGLTPRGSDIVNIQVGGPEGNRGYGFAVEVRSEALNQYLRENGVIRKEVVTVTEESLF